MIRPYEAADWDGVGRVCVQTGDSGGDATGIYANDDLLPAIYAYPYVVFEPDLAWVVVADSAEDDATDGEVVGYILGTSNVSAFVEWWAGDWAPRFEELLPVDDGWTGADLEVRGRGEHPEDQLNEVVRKHPGEFHIDLLPAAQGHGLGRTLIAVFAAALRDRGVRRLSIGVGAANQDALAFYRHLGFEELEREAAESGEVLAYRMGAQVADLV